MADGFLAFAPDLAQAGGGYDPEHFSRLFHLESGNFWFRARNRLIQWALGRHFPEARSFCEVGCGTGFVLSGIRSAYPHLELSGSEVFSAGLAFAQARVPGARLFQMDARSIPFEEEFDVVGAFDVIEHLEEDEAALADMRRAVKTGGGVLVTVPQHPWLWSWSDDAACHKRRYTSRELAAKIERAGLRLVKTTSFVSLLLPAMMFSRFGRREHSVRADPYAEFRIGRLANRLLEAVLELERALICAGVSFPAGGSLLAVARKA